MKTVALTCQHCAAPLPDLPASVDRVRCTHCSSLLTISRQDGRAWTQVVEELTRRQQQLADRVGELETRHRRVRRMIRRRNRSTESSDAYDEQVGLELALVALPGVATVVAAMQGGWFLWVLAITAAVLIWGGMAWKSRRDVEQREKRQARRRARKAEKAANRLAKSGDAAD